MVSAIDHLCRAIHIERGGTVVFKAAQDLAPQEEIIRNLAQRALFLRDPKNQKVNDGDFFSFEQECGVLGIEVEVIMPGDSPESD